MRNPFFQASSLLIGRNKGPATVNDRRRTHSQKESTQEPRSTASIPAIFFWVHTTEVDWISVLMLTKRMQKGKRKTRCQLGRQESGWRERRNSLRGVRGDGNEWACSAHSSYPKKEEKGWLTKSLLTQNLFACLECDLFQAKLLLPLSTCAK